MNQPEEIDVFVCGLGPAGGAAAACAAGRGATVVGVDRKAEPGVPVQCAEFVPNTIIRDLTGVNGITEQPVRSMTTYVETGPGDVTGQLHGRIISRQKLDALIVDQARQADGGLGVEFMFNVKVRAVAPDGTVTLSDGKRFCPRVLIGADGPHSVVGKAIGQVNDEIVETRQITVDLFDPHESTDIFLSRDIIGGYAWLFPKGKRAHIGVGVIHSERDRLKPLLDDLHQRMVGQGRVGTDIHYHTGGPIPVGGMLKPTAWLGDVLVLLAGDACGLTNPVTGAGIQSAIQSGVMAGEAAAEAAVHGHDDRQVSVDVATEFEQDMIDLFEAAQNRALGKRRAVLAAYDGGGPDHDTLRENWIVWPQYGDRKGEIRP